MFSFQEIPKFVINLSHRTDRMAHFEKEFSQMGWTFTRQDAIPGGSRGCALSHANLCQMILERGQPYAMICEDDLLFSKNAKDALQECEKNLNEIDWQLFHLGPTLHKPLLHVYKNLLDLTHASVTTDKLRGILGTTAQVVTPEACRAILRWNEFIPKMPDGSHLKQWDNQKEIWPIDQFMDSYVQHVCPSFTQKTPIAIQYNSFSDTENTQYNVEYLMDQNWKLQTPSII